MNALNVIKQACAYALEEADEGYYWPAAYASVADPLSVLEMIKHMETLLEHAEKTDPQLAEQVRQAIYSPTRVA